MKQNNGSKWISLQFDADIRQVLQSRAIAIPYRLDDQIKPNLLPMPCMCNLQFSILSSTEGNR